MCGNEKHLAVSSKMTVQMVVSELS